jgi:hypothetical protein
MPDQSAEELCVAIYAETRAFYGETAQQLGAEAYGFRILYGPPISRVPILFLGVQPGGGAPDADKGMQANIRHGHRAATTRWRVGHWRNVFRKYGTHRCLNDAPG